MVCHVSCCHTGTAVWEQYKYRHRRDAIRKVHSPECRTFVCQIFLGLVGMRVQSSMSNVPAMFSACCAKRATPANFGSQLSPIRMESEKSNTCWSHACREYWFVCGLDKICSDAKESASCWHYNRPMWRIWARGSALASGECVHSFTLIEARD